VRLVKEAVDLYLIEERDDLYYQTNESKPYSGWAKVMYDSGQTARLQRFKDGKLDGLHTLWHENGQKRTEGTYKNGKKVGLQTYWHENGQKWAEGTYKDGKPDGLWTAWHENGQKRNETSYKDGEVISAKWWNSKGEEVATKEEANQ